MATEFALKQHNTGPDLRVRLKGADGQVQDLTGATVKFSMSHARTGVVVVDHQPCNISGAATLGIVTYSWLAQDTAVIGDYHGEFEVTLPNGQKVSFPGGDYIPVQVKKVTA